MGELADVTEAVEAELSLRGGLTVSQRYLVSGRYATCNHRACVREQEEGMTDIGNQ